MHSLGIPLWLVSVLIKAIVKPPSKHLYFHQQRMWLLLVPRPSQCVELSVLDIGNVFMNLFSLVIVMGLNDCLVCVFLCSNVRPLYSVFDPLVKFYELFTHFQ